MKKRLKILCGLILCSLYLSANGVNIDWIYYILDNSTMTATVTYPEVSSYGQKSYYNDIIIPDTIIEPISRNKYVVTEIGNAAFKGATSSRIILPNTITKIGKGAFSSNYIMDSIVIPNSVTELGNGAFSNCQSLKKVLLSEELQEIQDNTFNACPKLDTIILPDKITKIGMSAFEGDSLLKYVYLPSGIDSIGRWAFCSCNSLTRVNLPQNLTFLGHHAFNGCSRLDSILLPYGLTDIGRAAFSCCRRLKYLYIPETVQRIGTWINNECDSLEHIQYDAISCVLDKTNAPQQEFAPFKRKSGSKMIKLSIGDNVMDIPDYLGHSLSGDIMLPNTLQSVGEKAFSGFTILNDTLPLNLEKISYRAFEGCVFPNGLVIPNNIELGVGAFSLIRSNTIKLPSNLQVIPDSAFYRARNLKNLNTWYFDNENMINKLDIPNSVTTIGKAALSGRLITLGNSVESLGEEVIPIFNSESTYNPLTGEYYFPLNDISIVSYAEEPPSWYPTEKELNSYKPIKNQITCFVPHGCIDTYRSQSTFMWGKLFLTEIEKGGTITYSTDNTIYLNILLNDFDNVFVYKVVILKAGYTIYEYTFDDMGNLIPNSEVVVNQVPKRGKHDEQGISVEISDVEMDSEYSYTVMAFDMNMNLVRVFADKFVPSEVATNIGNNTLNNVCSPTKIVDNGNVYILMPDGKKYSIIGELIN